MFGFLKIRKPAKFFFRNTLVSHIVMNQIPILKINLTQSTKFWMFTDSAIFSFSIKGTKKSIPFGYKRKQPSEPDLDWSLYPFSYTQWTEKDVDIRVKFVLSNYRKVAKFQRFLSREPFAIYSRTAINFLPNLWVINYLAFTLQFHEMFSHA